MNLRPLIITDTEREAIKRVMALAAGNVVSFDDLKKMVAGDLPATGDLYPDQTIILPMGYRVCFSHEMQTSREFRHISISIDEPGKGPNEHAVEMICREFGFTGGFTDWIMYVEQLDGQKSFAVNVAQPVVPI